MKHFNKHFNKRYFVDENGNRLQHSENKKHAEYGTANSVSEEKGSDNKKNNTSEYNAKYYQENKEKWADNKKSESKKSDGSKSSNDALYYDKDGKARFGHKKYDANDEDFKRTDGDKIAGTNLRMFTNKNGSLIIMGEGVKFSYPPGTQLTSEMKKAIAEIEKKKSSLNEEQYVAKMHNVVTKFADKQGLNTDIAGTDKTKKKKSSTKKNSSKSKESATPQTTTQTKSSTNGKSAYDQAKSAYYQEQAKKDDHKSMNVSSTELSEEEKKKKNNSSAKHFDDLGSVFIRDIF